jgi:cell division protein FtsW
MPNRKPFDFWIFIIVFILLALGIIMVFSASTPAAYNYTKNHDMYRYLRSQLIFTAIGFAVMFFMMNFNYRNLAKISPILLVISIILLIAVLVPGIGEVRNGARRWLFIFQPSEFAKLVIILFYSHMLSRKDDPLKSFLKGFIPYLMLLGSFALLLILEPHFSCTVIITLTVFVLLFCARARITHFLIVLIPVAGLFWTVITFTNYMRDRIMSFLNPWKYYSDEGWQIIQSLYAIGSGGLFGRGLGKSLQKFLYIPEPYNDFIFSILAEELGFVGVCAVIVLFLILIWRGIKVSMTAPDTFGSLTAVGITSLIAVQAFLNIAVVTKSIPSTGISLPFFSAGGSSLIILMCGVGILLNISRYSKYERI